MKWTQIKNAADAWAAVFVVLTLAAFAAIVSYVGSDLLALALFVLSAYVVRRFARTLVPSRSARFRRGALVVALLVMLSLLLFPDQFSVGKAEQGLLIVLMIALITFTFWHPWARE
jgi:hypothetical protein